MTENNVPASQRVLNALMACEAAQLEAFVRALVSENPSLAAGIANMLGYEMGERQRKAQAGPRLVGR